MGSLGVSNNATPIPQIRAGLADWTSLPFTRDFVQIKGHMAHGWLGSRRLVENVLYHEKVGHARIGGSFPLNLYGGIAHYAKWGGNHPRLGPMPSTIKDFFRVFIVVGGDENAPRGERDYMLGDHLGAWDFGVFLETNNLDLKLYRQFPLETKDNLKFKSPQDALTGINVDFKNQLFSVLSSITYEFLYTKYQDGPTRLNPDTDRDNFRGNENYYNHYLYMTGWTYNRRTIGNPLFIPRNSNLGVANNRIVAHHLGIASSFHEYSLNIKITYSRNYGNWGSGILEDINNIGWGEPYSPRKDQISSELSIRRNINFSNLLSTLSIGFFLDNGDLVGNNFGLSSSLRIIF